MVKLSSSATRIYEDKSQKIGSIVMASPVFDNRLNKMLEINVYHKIDDSQFVIEGDNYINYGHCMELKLLNKLDDDQLDLEFLQDNGLKGNVQGPMTLKEPLKSYIQKS